MEKRKLKWFDIAAWGVEGKGWEDTGKPFDRLSCKAEAIVTPEVWAGSRSPTGLCAHFNTDSPCVHARWTLEGDQLGEDNFNVCGFSGVDLYVFDVRSGAWRWAAAPPHFSLKDKNPDTPLLDGLSNAMRQYRLYLPLRNPTLKVEIGVEPSALFEPVAPRRDRPLVYYGSSIAHGAYAARSGLGCPQILGRRLNLPLVNLGFSGAAKMEPEMAGLIAELDARVFVLDALPNMDSPQVKERAEIFIRAICEARPRTPVVLVEDHPRMVAWLKPEETLACETKWRDFAAVHRELLRRGFDNLSYVKGGKLFGADNEASMDGVHPSDLGAMRMADILGPAITKALRRDA